MTLEEIQENYETLYLHSVTHGTGIYRSTDDKVTITLSESFVEGGGDKTISALVANEGAVVYYEGSNINE